MAALGGQLGSHGFGGGLVGHQGASHLRHRQVLGNAHQIARGDAGAAVGGPGSGGYSSAVTGSVLSAGVFRAHQLLQALALQSFVPLPDWRCRSMVSLRRGGATRPCHLAQVLLRLGAQGGAAEAKARCSFLTPTKGAGQQAEGRGERLADEVDDDLANPGPMRNCGSFSEPLMGRSRSITPRRSASSSRQAHGQAVGRAATARQRSAGSARCGCWRELPIGQHPLQVHVHAELAAFNAVACGKFTE